MKKLGDILLKKNPFNEILMGNEALVRAMVETKTMVVTSYPGSPTPEIATAIIAIPEQERPFYFEFSVNEKVAAEVAFGAALNGNLSAVFFKSVGLNVALDSVVQLGLMPLTGGMIVVLGDDPGANSSQNEQDTRNILKMARLTVFEPASPQEVYRYYKLAAQLAQKEKTAVVLRLTTHVCHARQKVAFGAYEPDNGPGCTDFKTDGDPLIPITTRAIEMKRTSMAKLSKAVGFIKQAGLNTVETGNDPLKRGVVTSGLTFLSLLDVMELTRFRPDILKLGAVNPLETDSVRSFLKSHDQVLILEELDDILEKEIKALAFENRIPATILGKERDEDFIGEYTPDKVLGILHRMWPDLFKGVPLPGISSEFPVPERPAQMCPGCGHRSAFEAIKTALKSTDITVADIGCHTLGFLPPYNMGRVLLCMGASPGIASGLSLFNIDKRIVAFLGDSTFFHAGLPGLMNTIFNHHNITLIIMENGTTAMTGHQDHAGSRIPIKKLLQGLGIDPIFECDTYQQSKLTDHVTEALKIKGLSVVIARHPCMLKFTREQMRKPGHVKKHVAIDSAVCTKIHHCIERFACPSFIRNPDKSIHVNLDLCIGDGSCRQVCPKGAIAMAEESYERV